MQFVHPTFTFVWDKKTGDAHIHVDVKPVQLSAFDAAHISVNVKPKKCIVSHQRGCAQLLDVCRGKWLSQRYAPPSDIVCRTKTCVPKKSSLGSQCCVRNLLVEKCPRCFVDFGRLNQGAWVQCSKSHLENVTGCQINYWYQNDQKTIRWLCSPARATAPRDTVKLSISELLNRRVSSAKFSIIQSDRRNTATGDFISSLTSAGSLQSLLPSTWTCEQELTKKDNESLCSLAENELDGHARSSWRTFRTCFLNGRARSTRPSQFF